MATDDTENEGSAIKTMQKGNESQWNGPFCFIQAADTQYGFIDLIAGKKGKEIKWDAEIELTKKAILAANRLQPRPKFFVVCGDLVDALPGDENKPAQERAFKKSFKDLDSSIPLVCVCGNHDVGNTPTPESIKHYRDKFGEDFFSFWVGGVKFIVLNSQYYKDGSLIPEFVEDQEKWLEKELKDANENSGKHTVVFQHIPWFLSSASEDNDYFNIDKPVRKRMLDKFKAAGVRSIFCGHYHRNAGGFDEGMEVIVTSAIGAQLGKDKSGMRIVKVLDNEIKHDYYDLDNIPQQISLDS